MGEVPDNNSPMFLKHMKDHLGLSELYGRRTQPGDVVGVMLDLHDKTISKSVLVPLSPLRPRCTSQYYACVHRNMSPLM